MTNDLGSIDELVLLAASILDGDAYGNSILAELETRAGKTFVLGTIHKALQRLEKDGLLRSRLGGATPTRGGRRKRLYFITNSGFLALQQARDVRSQLWSLIPSSLKVHHG